MSNPHLPSGRGRGLPFLVADDWSAEQALAVVELLDDLRELIYARYLIGIQELLRAQQGSPAEPNEDDTQF